MYVIGMLDTDNSNKIKIKFKYNTEQLAELTFK